MDYNMAEDVDDEDDGDDDDDEGDECEYLCTSSVPSCFLMLFNFF